MNLKRVLVSSTIAVATAIPAVGGSAGPATAAFPPLILVCDGYAATIYGTDGNNNIQGTAGADVIVGRGGNDVIEGNGGNDRICGGTGNDDLYGGSGNDRLFAGSGDDDVFGGTDNDYLHTADGLGGETASGQTGSDACLVDDADFDSSCYGPAG